MSEIDIVSSLIERSKEFFVPERNKNIFSIGGRGHYENPISDLLSFFLNPCEIHGLGDIFLSSMLSLSSDSLSEIGEFQSIQREVSTKDGKRIDIVIETNNMVILIENKIRHWVANPFKSYELYGRQISRGRRLLLIILSPRQEYQRDWKCITYSKYIEVLFCKIENKTLEPPDSKWRILTREFLLHVAEECVQRVMEKEKFDFAMKNYGSIHKLQVLGNEYQEELIRKGIDAAAKSIEEENLFNFSSKIHNWGQEGTALRILTFHWGPETNITFLLRNDGTYRLQSYIYNVSDSFAGKIREILEPV